MRLPLLLVLNMLCLGFHSSSFAENTFAPLRDIAPIDNPDILSPGQLMQRNLMSLDSSTPRTFKLGLRPWADFGWQMETGLLGSRYADWGFNFNNDWGDRHQYILDHSVAAVLQDSDPGERSRLIDQLAASEKYDLLVGDSQNSLTHAQWAEGAAYDENGTMASWMGICEGSAGASAYFPEPLHAVDLRISSGDIVRFHILDIKGLESLLWSAYNVSPPLTGSRCETDSPETDDNGVDLNSTCFDSNPAGFHIAVLNLLSLQKRPFIINRVPSIEVWNVPVLGYEVSYFKPSTEDTYANIAEAMETPSETSDDNFGPYRSSRTSHIVGVDMTIQVAAGTTENRDEVTESNVINMHYRYDLELDAAGEIVGGEWHQADHPDFMWDESKSFVPLTSGDLALGAGTTWDGTQVPSSWLPAIQQASRRNQPLEIIVKKLVDLSRQ
jgi:hypothetical protein